MAKAEKEGVGLSQPRTYLTRMVIFILLASFIAAILFPQIKSAFFTNPGLNGLILGVLILGILYALRQVIWLGPEVRWVNDFRRAAEELSFGGPA
jgi:hypothetical protein